MSQLVLVMTDIGREAAASHWSRNLNTGIPSGWIV
jgi:hypothetical protein